MEAYEYHAFLDFQEIYDDEFGTWGALSHRLNGAGVESVAEEVKQVRFAAANGALGGFLSKAAAAAQEPGANAQSLLSPLEPLLAAFFKSVAPQVAEKVQRALLVRFGTEVSQALKQPSFDAVKAPGEWLLLCAYLALHRVGDLTDEESAQTFDALGLVCPVVQAFQTLPPAEPDEPAKLSAQGFAELLRVLLRHESFLSQCRDLGVAQSAAALLADPAAAGFILLHQSCGAQWFNKERFELLLKWFLKLAPYAETGPEPRLKRQPELTDRAICDQLEEGAAAAGYRLDQLMNLLPSGS